MISQLGRRQGSETSTGANMTIHSVTVNIKDSSNSGGMATIALYMHDRMLADANSTLVSQRVIQVPAQGQIVTEILQLDTSSPEVNQAGIGWDRMIRPSMYVALIIDQSDLAYTSGPAFNLSPGDTAVLVLKAKN